MEADGLTAVRMRRADGSEYALALTRDGIGDAQRSWPFLPCYRPVEIELLGERPLEVRAVVDMVKRACAGMGEGAIVIPANGRPHAT